jgi:O-antigen ligase
LVVPVPQGWSQPLILSTIAIVFVWALIKGGPWAWVVAIGTVAAAVMARPALKDTWRMVCFVIVPVVLTGMLGTFRIASGTRITPSFVVVFVCIAVTTAGLLRQRVRWRQLPLSIPFALYWIGVALSAIPAVSKLHWARGLLEVTLGYGFFLLGYGYLQTRHQIDQLLKIFMGLSVVTVLLAILQHLLYDYVRVFLPLLYPEGEDLEWMDHWEGVGRMVGNWTHPSTLGSLINMAAPIALYYYLESEKPQLRYILIYGLFAVGVLLTSTRTPQVAFVVSFVLLALLLRKRISRLIFPLMAFFLILLITAPSVFSSITRFDLSDPTEASTVEGRAEARAEAFLLFIRSPIFGVGKYNYQDRVFITNPNAQGATHNVPLQEAAETGLVGLVPFLILLVAAFRGDFRRSRLPPELRAIAATLFVGCIAILVESMAENSLLLWQIGCMFWLFRGMSIAIRTRPEGFAIAATQVA